MFPLEEVLLVESKLVCLAMLSQRRLIISSNFVLANLDLDTRDPSFIESFQDSCVKEETLLTSMEQEVRFTIYVGCRMHGIGEPGHSREFIYIYLDRMPTRKVHLRTGLQR